MVAFNKTNSGFCIVKKRAWVADIVSTARGLMMAIRYISAQVYNTPRRVLDPNPCISESASALAIENTCAT